MAPNAVRQPTTRFIMIFSASGAIIQNPQRNIVRAIASKSTSSDSWDSKVTVVEV